MTDKAPTPSKDRTRAGELPTMLTQAIVMAAVLAVGELLCCPLYVRFAPVFYPLSWALVAILLAIGFAYTVGFAWLWCAESFAYRMKRAVQPVVYAVAGAIGFGVWTAWVVIGVMNMVTGRLGLGVVNQGNTVLAGINGAILGMVAFFLAFTVAPRLAKRKGLVIAAGVVTLLAAAGGIAILAAMLRTL